MDLCSPLLTSRFKPLKFSLPSPLPSPFRRYLEFGQISRNRRGSKAPKKPVKMSATDFNEKITSLKDQWNNTDFESLDVFLKPDGIWNRNEKDGIEKKVVDFSRYKEDVDNRMWDNVRFRKVANFLHTVMKVHDIQTLLDPFHPRVNLIVEYPNEQLVYWGMEYEPEVVSSKPQLKFIAKSITNWTLLFVAQNLNNTAEQHLHWMITNIPGGDFEKGETVVDYIPASSNDNYRYHYILCQQATKIVIPHQTSPQNQFNTRNFLTEYNLLPKAINFFNIHIKKQPPL